MVGGGHLTPVTMVTWVCIKPDKIAVVWGRSADKQSGRGEVACSEVKNSMFMEPVRELAELWGKIHRGL